MKMLEYITLTVDGAKLRVPKGTSVLDAALEYGICIPHLCHVPSLTPYGACRLCIVEHVKNGRSTVTASCTLEAREGMVIRTDTDKIRRLRRNIAELLVAEAPNSKAIQDMAVRCGVTEVRFPFHNENCVMCGRCVRVCGELWQAHAIGFLGRGNQRKLGFPFRTKPEFCKNCNTCVDICPMTITPCAGPMKDGEEYLCGLCSSQLSMAESIPDTCVYCELGKGFSCIRQEPLP
jgi:NADH dehydrogenase/NADH:ubiquinone oxidoreductase subunit G